MQASRHIGLGEPSTEVRHTPCVEPLRRRDSVKKLLGRATGDTLNTYLEMMESVPTQAYLGAAVGSLALSALLRLFGKKDAAVFVGQWPPTFLLFALAYKLLRPSNEDVMANGHEAVHQASNLVTASR